MPRRAALRRVAALAVARGAAAPPGARSDRRATAHAASSYLMGIGDEETEMFGEPLWKQLHTKIARYIAPYDAAVKPFSLTQAQLWIHGCRTAAQQVLVAFYHSEYTPTKMPSVAPYQQDVQKFVKTSRNVHQYQPWDETNRGNIRVCWRARRASASAQYYQALLRVCKGCTVLGLDVLDAENISPTLAYISEFKSEIGKLRTVMPSIWGLHNYSDINRLQSFRTREIARALGGQVWLTETGGIVQFGGAFPNRNGSGLTRAAKVLDYMFNVAGSNSRIKRLTSMTGPAEAQRRASTPG